MLLALQLMGWSSAQAANIILPTEATSWNIPDEAIDVNQAREICANLAVGATTGTKYYVMGYVKSIDSRHANGIANYGNALFYLEQEKGANSSLTFMAYQVYGPEQEKLTDVNSVDVGDFVVLYGELTHYKYSSTSTSVYETVGKGAAYIWKSTNTILGGQGGDNWNIKLPDEAYDWNIPAEAIDVNQAREICANLAVGATTGTKYYVMGYVKSIDSRHANGIANYGNALFYLEQEKGANSSLTFMAYQVYGPEQEKLTDVNSVDVGDFVVLYGELTHYKYSSTSTSVYETVGQGAAYIWKSTNPLLGGESGDEGDDSGEGGDEGDDPGEENENDGRVVIRDTQTWTTSELADYVGQEIEFKNHFYVTNNSKDGQLTIAPRMIFIPTNQTRPLTDEYYSLLELNEQATVTLTDVSGYHRIGERLHNMKVKVNSTTSMQLLSCDWRGNTREEMQKGYDLQAINARGEHTLLVCYMNLEYYLTSNFGTGYGPDDDSEHDAQRAKTSQALAKINADIYGFVEVQRGQNALAELAADLTVNTGRTFTYVNDNGKVSGSYTKSGYVYCSDVVYPSGSMIHNNTGVSQRKKVQAFVEHNTDEKFILSVNHFKAKSGDGTGLNADQGDGQGQFNADRVEEAQSIVTNYNNYLSQFDDEDLLIVGDLNAYGKEDPIHTLLNAKLIDLHRTFHADSSYSYVYKGQVGYLDHAICNQAMYEQVTGMTVYHINSPERDSYTYNGSNNDGSMFRCSDHDPILIGLSLGGIQQKEDDNTPTYFKNTHSPSPITNCQKLLRNGQLIILRDGVEYNAMGQEIQ